MHKYIYNIVPKLQLLEEAKGEGIEGKNGRLHNNEIHHICVGTRHTENCSGEERVRKCSGEVRLI
jgi:hypothetical protein